MKKEKIMVMRVLLFVGFFAFFGNHLSFAQPSGGPYGPLKKKYEIPATKGKVIYVAPDGKKDAKGKKLSSPTTIEEAIKMAKTNDVLILRGGTYRTGDLTFNQGITIQPYEDEQPVLKGTFEAKNWKKESEKLWSTKWERLFPATYESWWRREREEKRTPLHRFNNDVVFIDGQFLQSAGNKEEVDSLTFYVDYDAKTIYIGQNPEGHNIEITAFRKAIFRTTKECNGKKSDGIGPKIYGLEITQYPDTTVHIDGFYPDDVSAEEDHGNDVKGTVIENCDISNCFRIGVFTIGDNLTIRSCKISNTSTEGLYIVASDDVLLEKNIFAQNNIELITGYYPSAVKIFNQSHRVVCKDNLVTDMPNSNGIWYDVGNVDGVFINNWVQNVGYAKNKSRWPMNGFFFEISKGATVAGNVFMNCGNGILVLNSSNVHMYNNTLANSSVAVRRDGRSAVGDHFGWHPKTGPDVDERFGHIFSNNIIACDEFYPGALLNVSQREELCDRLKDSPVQQMDYNIYLVDSKNIKDEIAWWSPVSGAEKCMKGIASLDELQKVFKGAAKNSKIVKNKNLPVFKSFDLGNFELLPEFQHANSAMKLPESIQKLLGLDKNDKPYVGAYPVK